MSDYVAARDCTILGVEFKAGQEVKLDMDPAYQKSLIDGGLIAPKGSVAQPPRPRVQTRPIEGEAGKE